MAEEPATIPPPREDDDDDVAWALQTAAVQWNRGARADAVVWLRRAVDSAGAIGNPERGAELNALAADLTERMLNMDSRGDAPEVHTTVANASDIDALLDEDVGDLDESKRDSFSSIDIPISFDGAPAAEKSNPYAKGARPELDSDAFAPPVLFGGAADEDEETDEAFADDDEDFDTVTDPALAPEPGEPIGVRGNRLPSFDDAEPLSASPDELGRPTPLVPEPLPIPGDRPSNTMPSVKGHTVPRAGRLPTGSPLPPKASEPPRPGRPSRGPTGRPPASSPIAAPSEPRASKPPASRRPPAAAGVALEGVRGFQDLPADAQGFLAITAKVHKLAADEEVSFFGAALVAEGEVAIMPTIADAAGASAHQGDLIYVLGTLTDDAVAIRAVATKNGTVVATWAPEEIAESMEGCPWVAEELAALADRYQALAGAMLGPLGERFDENLRHMVTDRLEVRSIPAGETIVEAGKPVPGMHIIGGGRIELFAKDAAAPDSDLGPGDFLFPAQVMGGGKAPLTAKAGEGGALILFGDRHLAQELMMSVPPLIEMLAG